MKINLNKQVETNVSKILLDLPIRYGDENIPFDFPCRVKPSEDHYGDHDRLILMVNIDTGEILNPEFPKDFSYYVSSLKVCDEGIYIIYDDKDQEIARIEDYVPNDIVPGKYGDYVELNIKNGFICNWYVKPDVSEFFKKDE